MNNHEPISPGQDPVVSQDGFADTTGSETKRVFLRTRHEPSEEFAKAIKSAFKPKSSTIGRTNSTWESIPGVNDIGGRLSSNGRIPSLIPSPIRRGIEGSVSDVNAARSDLGDLLAADPARPHESYQPESEISRSERQDTESRGTPEGENSLPVADVRPRKIADEVWNPSFRSQSPVVEKVSSPDVSSPNPVRILETSRSDSLTVHQGKQSGYPGLLDLLSPAASGDSGPGTKALIDTSKTSNGLTAPNRVTGEGAIGLLGANPIAEQLSFSAESPVPQDRSPGAMFHSVDIRESSPASTAFAPVLSETGLSGDVGTPDFVASGGREEAGQRPAFLEAWSGRSGSEELDHASNPPVDLSKTNDLLQQLLDEFRKGHQPFLPLAERNSTGY